MNQIAFTLDRAAAALSPITAALHQRGYQRLSAVAQASAIALDDTAIRLVWWGRPVCDR
jgi:hypothetical protein